MPNGRYVHLGLPRKITMLRTWTAEENRRKLGRLSECMPEQPQFVLCGSGARLRGHACFLLRSIEHAVWGFELYTFSNVEVCM